MAEVIETRGASEERILYVLGLADGCYYVGQSRKENVEARIRKHFRGKGSVWTKLHPPLEIIEKESVYGNYRDIELLENAKTIDYMQRYGLEKVRGGFFSHSDLAETEKNLRSHGIVIK